MRRTAAALAALLALFALPAVASSPPRATLAAFADEAELAALFKRWRDEEAARRAARAPQEARALAAAPPVMLSAPGAAAKADEAVTNVQHAGVDEGGIVKVHGDHLVILRRGRLFTVAIGDGALRPVSKVDAYAPDASPDGAWYDELIVSGDTVVVIGYSYARGGTEIGLFDITPRGHLAYRATYHLRSNDYYSSRNYASRLIGTRLVFYSPLYVSPYAPDPFAGFPAMRRWHAQATRDEFRRIAPAWRVYRADDLDPQRGVALHSVTSCDLAQRELACESTAVMGPPGRVFYVSPSSVYVWTAGGHWRGVAPQETSSTVFRIPLDGSAPSALRAAGSPIDQFSFLEDGEALNVLVRANGRGDGMWHAEQGKPSGLKLLRVPLSSFGNGREAAPADAYRPLPDAGALTLQNRFIGPWLLYGSGMGMVAPRHLPDHRLFAVRYREGYTYAVPVGHAVERIEAMGSNAVAVGNDGPNLRFSSVRLDPHPMVAASHARPEAVQGDLRSHGFFYRADDAATGLLGLPVADVILGPQRRLQGIAPAVVFLRNDALTLSELGALRAKPVSHDDGCRASCVDWYGNARPLFLRGRVFALMGYEIVEGRVDGRRIVETRRISFAPAGHVEPRAP